MPKIKRKDRRDRDIVQDWYRSKEGQEALRGGDLMLDPYGGPISVMLPEAEVSALGNAPRDLSKDFLEFLRYGAGMAPILGETLDYAESAYANKYGTDFFGNPMHGPLNAGITTAGIVVPNVIETPVKAGVNVVKKAIPKMGPKVKKFKSSIDWRKWNPETPNHPELMEEYLDIERRSKADGTWMKNADGTDFDGPPELFVQMQSKAFKEAFPEGYDKLYRGVTSYDGNKISPTGKSDLSTDHTTFFTEDRHQALEYSGYGGGKTIGSDYESVDRGIFELAYPPNTSRVDIDARGSSYYDIQKFDEKALRDRLSELEHEVKTSTSQWEIDGALQEAELIQEALDLRVNRRLSSDAEVDEFVKRFDDWRLREPELPSNMTQMYTDDVGMFMQRNPDKYDRVVFRGLLDENIGDVNIINTNKAPFPKSLKGNVGTFNLNDPNVFKAVVPAVGLGAAATYKNKDEMSQGGSVKLKKMSTGGATLKKGDPPKGTSPYFFSVFPDGYPKTLVDINGEKVPIEWDEYHDEGSFITAEDIAQLADEKAGPNAKYTFDEVMNIFAVGESGNKNVYQEGGPAQGEWQMELAARQDAANYVNALAEGLGLDSPSYSEEDLRDITKLPYEDRRLLAYAYMYGPEKVPTKDVLTGKTPVPQFWMKHWNKGQVDRSQEFGDRVSDYLK